MTKLQALKYFLFSKKTLNRIKLALKEDLGQGDVTSRLLVPVSARGKAVIIAREPGVFCGAQAAKAVFQAAGKDLKVRFLIQEGKPYRAGAWLLEVKGNVRAILAAERTVLNFLGRLCGIATLTSEYARRAKPYGVKILDTRKTTPLWREIEKYAVKTGGGMNHRFGLFDEVFVKENHRVYGNPERLKKYRGPFEIEVRNQKELLEALGLSPRVILFDNWKPAALKKAVRMVKNYRGLALMIRHRGARPQQGHPILEASGGVTLNNVRQYASTGVDWISVGALTHSVKAANLSLLMV